MQSKTKKPLMDGERSPKQAFATSRKKQKRQELMAEAARRGISVDQLRIERAQAARPFFEGGHRRVHVSAAS